MPGPFSPMGAMMMCTFGAAPGTESVLPVNKVVVKTPVGNIMDNKPFVNVTPFAMCISPSNPAVAAALGAPMPCTPMTAAPWTPGNAKAMVGNMPALDMASMCTCSYGGVITFVNTTQFNAVGA